MMGFFVYGFPLREHQAVSPNQDVYFILGPVEKNMKQENTLGAFLLGASIFLVLFHILF